MANENWKMDGISGEANPYRVSHMTSGLYTADRGLVGRCIPVTSAKLDWSESEDMPSTVDAPPSIPMVKATMVTVCSNPLNATHAAVKAA